MKIFENVAGLAAAHLKDGQIVETKGYTSPGDGGQARYLIQTAVQYAGTPDEFGDHTLANGNVAVLQIKAGLYPVNCFGAGVGSSDIPGAVQAAINAANAAGGGGVIFGPQTYDFGAIGTIAGYTRVSLRGSAGETILDFSNRTDYFTDQLGGLISYKGTAENGVLSTDTIADLTSDALIGDVILSLNDTTGILAGELLELTATSTGPWVDSSVAVRIAQLVHVLSVDSVTQLTIDTPAYDDYTVANSGGIRRITPVEDVTIRGLTLKGKGRDVTGAGDLGLRFFYGKNILVENCKFDGVDSRALDFISCYSYTAKNNLITTDEQGANTSVNYGIVTSSASIYGRIADNTILNYRHGVVSSHLSMALLEEYPGVNRFIGVSGNFVSNTWHAGIATHNDIEFLTVSNNQINNCAFGINVRDKNVKILDNRISSCGQGVYLTSRFQKININNNEITDCSNALSIDNIDTGFTPNHINVDNNRVSACIQGIVFDDASSTIPGIAPAITVRNNSIEGLTGEGNSAAIRTSGAEWSVHITGNDISNLSATCEGVRIDGSLGSVIIGNRIITSERPITIISGDKTAVTNNVFADYVSGPIFNTGTNSGITGNIDLGSGVL